MGMEAVNDKICRWNYNNFVINSTFGVTVLFTLVMSLTVSVTNGIVVAPCGRSQSVQSLRLYLRTTGCLHYPTKVTFCKSWDCSTYFSATSCSKFCSVIKILVCSCGSNKLQTLRLLGVGFTRKKFFSSKVEVFVWISP